MQGIAERMAESAKQALAFGTVKEDDACEVHFPDHIGVKAISETARSSMGLAHRSLIRRLTPPSPPPLRMPKPTEN